MMTKILISGGSGLLGSNLTKILELKGFEVCWLSRNPQKTTQKSYFWNPSTGEIDPACLQNTQAIINLAGAGVADKRWTVAHKKEILDSRLQSAQLIYKALETHPNQVQCVLSASAVGYYGNNPEPKTTEESPMGNTFLAEVCRKWEVENLKYKQLGIRCGIIRIGIILSKEGGFLKEVSTPIQKGFGAVLGDGEMATPWIEIDDLSRMFVHLLEHQQLSGIYNGVAPISAKHKDLVYYMAKHLNKKLWLPGVPPFMLRLLFGEIAPMLLANQDISAEKILKTGFRFQFPEYQDAISYQLDRT